MWSESWRWPSRSIVLDVSDFAAGRASAIPPAILRVSGSKQFENLPAPAKAKTDNTRRQRDIQLIPMQAKCDTLRALVSAHSTSDGLSGWTFCLTFESKAPNSRFGIFNTQASYRYLTSITHHSNHEALCARSKHDATQRNRFDTLMLWPRRAECGFWGPSSRMTLTPLSNLR